MKQLMPLVFAVGIIACCTKKRITTIIFTIFGTMLMSVLNVLPIPKLQGKLFLLDAHSLITTNINEFIVSNDAKKYLNNVVILVIWIVVLFTVYYVMIAHQRSEGKD